VPSVQSCQRQDSDDFKPKSASAAPVGELALFPGSSLLGGELGNYIAVDLKVVEVLAPMVARSAGISEDRALAGLVRLWHRCWSTTSDVVTLSQLGGCFGGEAIELIAKVLSDDFLEPVDGGYRVRGAARYLRLKASRRRGAEMTNAARSSARSKSVEKSTLLERGKRSLNDALSPSTEHRAPNTEVKASAPAKPSPPKRAASTPDPRHAPLVAALVAASPGYAFTGRDARAVAALLKLGDPAEVELRWRRALSRDTFPRVRALHELVGAWNHFTTVGGADVRRGLVRAEDQEHLHVVGRVAT